METRGVLGDACTPKQGFSALSFKLQYEQRTIFQWQYHSSSALRECPLLGFKYTFSIRQMFIIISVRRPLNIITDL